MRVYLPRERARVIGGEGGERERRREKEKESSEGGKGGGMRETFSSVPTARATPLSLFLYVPSLSVSRAAASYTLVRGVSARVCVCVRASVCISTLCVPPPKAQVSRSGEEGEEGGGHRRRWTARDAACRESLREIETARPLCLFVCDRRERMRACERARRPFFPFPSSSFGNLHPPTTYRNLTP